MGPRTGRAAGFCAGFGMPGYLNPIGRGGGAGFGRGRGFWNRGFGGGGFGWRNMFAATGLPGWTRFGGYPGAYAKPDPEEEKQALKAEAAGLEAEIEAIKSRLAEIEKNVEEAR